MLLSTTLPRLPADKQRVGQHESNSFQRNEELLVLVRPVPHISLPSPEGRQDSFCTSAAKRRSPRRLLFFSRSPLTEIKTVHTTADRFALAHALSGRTNASRSCTYRCVKHRTAERSASVWFEKARDAFCTQTGELCASEQEWEHDILFRDRVCVVADARQHAAPPRPRWSVGGHSRRRLCRSLV